MEAGQAAGGGGQKTEVSRKRLQPQARGERPVSSSHRPVTIRQTLSTSIHQSNLDPEAASVPPIEASPAFWLGTHLPVQHLFL